MKMQISDDVVYTAGGIGIKNKITASILIIQFIIFFIIFNFLFIENLQKKFFFM